MGYTTDFQGHIDVAPVLNEYEIAYLRAFAATRRMHRQRGPFYCGTGHCGQDREYDILDYNRPAFGQPNLWCQWVPSEDGAKIEWDQGEKFYDPAMWMGYIIDTFLSQDAAVRTRKTPLPELPGTEGWFFPPAFNHFTFDHVLNGRIEAQGEDPDDRWDLVVKDNEVTVVYM